VCSELRGELLRAAVNCSRAAMNCSRAAVVELRWMLKAPVRCSELGSAQELRWVLLTAVECSRAAVGNSRAAVVLKSCGGRSKLR
jgi:hypothetical protein